jgi:thioredoxin reductase
MKNRIIVLGFGPAGMACAIQLRRMGLDPLVIEKNRPGGMLRNAWRIENYPGFPGGISGEKLANLIEKQADQFNLKVVKDEVKTADYQHGTFILTGQSTDYTCDVLVIATGTAPMVPDDFPNALSEQGFVRTDISGLKNISGKVIGIIGAGDAAFDYSLSLAGNDQNSVHIFNRGAHIKALGILQERVGHSALITYHGNCVLKELQVNPGRRLLGTFSENIQETEFIMDYLIFATGRVPALGFLSKRVREEMGILHERHCLYQIGDVKNSTFRQLSLAAGDGVRAAMEIFRHESH